MIEGNVGGYFILRKRVGSGERTMVCTKIQRCDANEAGAIEVTTTSELHAEAERTQKQKREETVTSDSGGSGRERDVGRFRGGRDRDVKLR